jgi:hypothetical protein
VGQSPLKWPVERIFRPITNGNCPCRGLSFVLTAEPLSTSQFRKLPPAPTHPNPPSPFAIHSSVCFSGGAGSHRPPYRSGAEMKKIFGAKKDKGPPPSIQDATERVSTLLCSYTPTVSCYCIDSWPAGDLDCPISRPHPVRPRMRTD